MTLTQPINSLAQYQWLSCGTKRESAGIGASYATSPRQIRRRVGLKKKEKRCDRLGDGGLAGWGKVTASEIRGSDRPSDSGIRKDQGRRM